MVSPNSYSDRHIRKTVELISQQYDWKSTIHSGIITALVDMLSQPEPKKSEPKKSGDGKIAIDDDSEVATVPLIFIDDKEKIDTFFKRLSPILANSNLIKLLNSDMKQRHTVIREKLKAILLLVRPLIISQTQPEIRRVSNWTDDEGEGESIESPQQRIEGLLRKLSAIRFSYERTTLEQSNLFSFRDNTLTFSPAFYRIEKWPKQFINITDLYYQTPEDKEQQVTTWLLKERLLETVPKWVTIKGGNRPSEDRLARINGTISKQEIDHEKFLASLRKLCGISGLIYEENI